MTNEEFLEKISEEGEEWRDVVGYEGLYAISSYGRLVSLAKAVRRGVSGIYIQKQRIINPRRNKKNTEHQANSLYKNGMETRVQRHRLVAMAFLPNPNNLPIVEHLDCDPTNNHVSNLRWTDQVGNMNNPLTLQRMSVSQKKRDMSMYRKPVVCIHPDGFVKEYESVTDVSQDGFNAACVSMACREQIKSHHKCKWYFLSDYKNLLSAMSKNSKE